MIPWTGLGLGIEFEMLGWAPPPDVDAGWVEVGDGSSSFGIFASKSSSLTCNSWILFVRVSYSWKMKMNYSTVLSEFFVKKEKRNPFFIQYLLYENITFYIGLRYHVTLWKSCWKIFHLKSISMNKNSKFLLKQIYSSNFTRFFFSWHWMIVKLFLTLKYINIKEIISIYHFSDFNVKI